MKRNFIFVLFSALLLPTFILCFSCKHRGGSNNNPTYNPEYPSDDLGTLDDSGLYIPEGTDTNNVPTSGSTTDLTAFIVPSCLNSLAVDNQTKTKERDYVENNLIILKSSSCLTTPRGWYKETYSFSSSTALQNTDYINNTYIVSVDDYYIKINNKTEFLSTKIPDNASMEFTARRTDDSKVWKVRFTGPKYQPKTINTLADIIPDFFIPTDVKKRISLSPVQDSSTAFTFVCVSGMDLIGWKDGWDISHIAIDDSTKLYKCVEDQCQDGNYLYGITGYTGDVANATIDDVLKTKFESNSFTIRWCSGKYNTGATRFKRQK